MEPTTQGTLGCKKLVPSDLGNASPTEQTPVRVDSKVSPYRKEAHDMLVRNSGGHMNAILSPNNDFNDNHKFKCFEAKQRTPPVREECRLRGVAL